MTSYSSVGGCCALRGAQDLDALDRYASRLWRVKLPRAAAVDASALRLVWLTAGFSVPAERAAVGAHVGALDSAEIARRAHLPLAETDGALQALVDDGRLEPLPGTSKGCLRVEREHESAPTWSVAST
jgi:hypothetical protein